MRGWWGFGGRSWFRFWDIGGCGVEAEQGGVGVGEVEGLGIKG